MPTDATTLKRRGRKTPTTGLLQQVNSSLTHARKHRDALAEYGFTPANYEALVATSAELDALLSARTLVLCEAETARKTEVDACKRARSFLKALRLAVPLMLRKHGITAVTKRTFLPARPLGRSSGKLVDHLVCIEGLVAKYDEQLRPYFRGEPPSQILAEVRSTLAKRDGWQELRRATAPLETSKLNLVKGRLLEQLDDLNGVAQIAFLDDPLIAGTFDKRHIARARRTRRRRGETEEAAAVAAASRPVSTPVEGEAGEGAAKVRRVRLSRSEPAGAGRRWRLSGGKGIAVDAVREAPGTSGSAA